jgi:protein ImuA
MRASDSMAGDSLARLRRRIAEIEGRPAGLGQPSPAEAGVVLRAAPHLGPRRGKARLAFGVPGLDRALSGGLPRNALHEIRSETTADGAAAAGFAAALLARLAAADDRPLLWVVESAAFREAGFPYGPGLDRFGLDHRRLVLVRVRRADEALWVFEEGLRCRGLAAVMAEIRGHPRRLDLTASRRLALRAAESGVMGLLLRQAGRAEPGAALTRWQAASRAASILDGFASGVGHPAWRLVLERSRLGPTGIFDLEWDHDTRAFAPALSAPPLSQPLSAAPADRPHPPAAAGTVVALRRAS